MPTIKLSDRLVKHAQPDGGRVEYWDAVLSGFGLRVAGRRGGEPVKTWFVRYRMGGRQYRMKLGTYPALSLANARAAAENAFKAVARGENPAAKAAISERAYTVTDLVIEFVERYARPKNRSWAETARLLGVVPDPSKAEDGDGNPVEPEKRPLIAKGGVAAAWKRKRAEDVTRRDVVELLDGIVDRGAPMMANRTLAHLRRMFGWAVERDILTTSPVANIKMPAKEQDRDRVLSDEELRTAWIACRTLGWPFGHIISLLIVTAQRRDEVASMARADLDRSHMLWVMPRTETKSNRLHEVPLSPLAMEVLSMVPGGDGPFVFSTTGKTPVSGFSKAKARLDELMLVELQRLAVERGGDAKEVRLEPWRLHDLRRTAASGMARLGVPVHVLSHILNHTPGSTSGVTAIYNRYAYLPEKRAALVAWAEHVSSIVNSGDTLAKGPVDGLTAGDALAPASSTAAELSP